MIKIVFFVYTIFAIIIFWKLPFTFFQQDEWAIFGNYLYWEKANLGWFDRLFLYEQYTHIIPFSNLFSYIEFSLFGLNFFPYGIVSIIIHFVNSVLVSYLGTLITKRQFVGFVAGLFFLVNSIHHQAVTWVATAIGTAGSAFFLLLSLIFFTKFVIDVEKGQRYLFFSMLMFFISLGFKETSLFVFLFLPIFRIFMEKKKTLKKIKDTFIPFTFIFIIYLFVRLYFIFFGYKDTLASDVLSQPSVSVYLYRIFSVPFKFLVQTFIPMDNIIFLARAVIKLAYPQFVQEGTPNPYIVESIGSDIVTFFIAMIMIFSLFFSVSYLRKTKEKSLVKTIIISVIFIALSSFPFIIIPGKAGFFSLIDGRHLYITIIFSSLLLASICYLIYRLVKIYGAKIILATLILLFLFYNVIGIRNDINQQVGTGFIRKSILNQILKLNPSLSSDVIFYVTSDKSYYGLPPEEKIVPFQSGFGQTLLVWYNTKGENFPSCFFKQQFLYQLISEGYRRCSGRGFGYFRKLDNLKSAMKENKISKENIVGLSYNSSSHKINIITKDVIKDLFSL